MYVAERTKKVYFPAWFILNPSINPKLLCVQPPLSTIVCHFLPSTDQCYHSTRTLYGLLIVLFLLLLVPTQSPAYWVFLVLEWNLDPLQYTMPFQLKVPQGYPYASNSLSSLWSGFCLSPQDIRYLSMPQVHYRFFSVGFQTYSQHRTFEWALITLAGMISYDGSYALSCHTNLYLMPLH